MRIVSIDLNNPKFPEITLPEFVNVAFEGNITRVRGNLTEIVKLLPSVCKRLDIVIGDHSLVLDSNEIDTFDENTYRIVRNPDEQFVYSLYISENIRIAQSPKVSFDKATFDVYLLCYNESKIIPKIFQHYNQARRIVVIDNESTDGSQDLVESLGGIVKTVSTNGELDDEMFITVKNSLWKESRGKVDFVVVQDADEFLHFPDYPNDISSALTILRDKGVHYVIPTGYEMFPKLDDEPITNQRLGYPNYRYNKPFVFNPNKIEESNYTYGAHEWFPKLNSKSNPSPIKACLLHYKHLGLEWEYKRRKLISSRFGEINKKLNVATEYNLSDSDLYEYVKKFYDDEKIRDLSDVLDTRSKVTGYIPTNGKLGLLGGLGNQLFVVASTLAVALEKNQRPYFTYSDNAKQYNTSIFHKLEFTEDRNCKTELYGYFQSSKYFKPYWNQIQPLLTFSEDYETLRKIREFTGKIIAVHVRRKDYVYLKWDLPISYYTEAMSKFPNCKFAIFSDDVNWVRNSFNESNCFIVNQPDESKTLWLFSQLDGYIIANSTFSWWGAFLGTQKRSKTVIAPYPWFKTQHSYNKDIYEAEWIKIEY